MQRHERRRLGRDDPRHLTWKSNKPEIIATVTFFTFISFLFAIASLASEATEDMNLSSSVLGVEVRRVKNLGETMRLLSEIITIAKLLAPPFLAI